MSSLPSKAMKNYLVIMLGPSGSGKTVFLSSLYKQLSTQGDLGFFLKVDSGEKRKRLNSIYAQVALDEKWPQGTRYSDVSEWTFTCCVKSPKNLQLYDACSFTYLDYAGGRITDEMGEELENIKFNNRMRFASAFLGLLDGQKLCSLMRGEKAGKLWELKDLANMIIVMQESDKPVHFVISKWDIVQQFYSLDQIRDRLLQISEFKNLVKYRTQAGSTVRLIPVSAVGTGFAIPQADGSMKKTMKDPHPFQVEMPLACILPDMIKLQVDELVRKRQSELDKATLVDPNITMIEKLRKLFAGSLKSIRESLPERYQFAEKTFESIIVWAETPVEEKIKLASERTEELKVQQQESLNQVADEESALNHSINCFKSLENQLNFNFPASELSVK